MSEIVFNLARNAIEAASEVERGRVIIELEPNGTILKIRVHDNGKGLPEEVLRNLCKPFVSSKPTGTGLDSTPYQKESMS